MTPISGVSVYEVNCSVEFSLFFFFFKTDIAVPSVVVFVMFLGTVFAVIWCVARGRCCRCRRTHIYNVRVRRNSEYIQADVNLYVLIITPTK